LRKLLAYEVNEAPYNCRIELIFCNHTTPCTCKQIPK